MRYIDNGCFYSVAISKREVEDFAERWPCFGSRRALWAQFDKDNGDLVDIRGDSGMDGSGVLALLEDAKTFAADKRARYLRNLCPTCKEPMIGSHFHGGSR